MKIFPLDGTTDLQDTLTMGIWVHVFGKLNINFCIYFNVLFMCDFRCQFWSDVDEFDKNATVWLGKVCRSDIS